LRKLVGTASAGPVDIVCNFNPADTTQQYLLASYAAGRREKFKLLMTNADGSEGSFVEFDGFVASKSQANEFDAARTITFSIAIDGALGAITDQA
jgi:hypothetical protein